MYKLLKIISTIILFIFSIIYTNKCIELIQNKDPLMKEIINNQKKYQVKPQDAIITKNTMIPGIKGKKINIKKSYQKMKKLGSFNENLLVYQEITPNISYFNNYNKIIISGNPKKNNISLIFNINNQTLFNKIDQILKSNNVVGNIIYNNLSITNTNFINTLSENNNKKINYCLTYNLNINKDCQNNKKYTILSQNIINNYHLTNTKKIIKNGIIITYNFNENNPTDLDLIIKYIKNNNYNIVSIDELIKE